VLSFFLPCLDPTASGSGSGVSPLSYLWFPPSSAAKGFFLFEALGLWAPLLIGALLLGDAWRPDRARRAIHWLLLIGALLWAFALATEGSLLGTTGDPEAERFPRILALALFAGPLVAGAVVAAQVLRGAPHEITRLVVRGSLGVLLFLDGLYWMAGWGSTSAPGRILSFVLPGGGLAVLASSALDLLRSRAGGPGAPQENPGPA
jgi:hypothetical protein